MENGGLLGVFKQQHTRVPLKYVGFGDRVLFYPMDTPSEALGKTRYSRDSECTFQTQSETITIDFPAVFDMAVVRGVMRLGGEAVAPMKAVTYTNQFDTSLDRNDVVRPSQQKKDPLVKKLSVSA